MSKSNPESDMPSRINRNSGLCLACVVWAALTLGSCSDKIRGVIKKELPRPGGGVTAILTEDYGKDVYYEVYLKRENDGFVERVFSTFDNDAVPSIRWQNPSALVIHMTCGDIVRYENEFGFDWNGLIDQVFIGLEGNQLCKHAGQATPGL